MLCRVRLQPTVHAPAPLLHGRYRAPELLLDARHYTGAVDVWAVRLMLLAAPLWGHLVSATAS